MLFSSHRFYTLSHSGLSLFLFLSRPSTSVYVPRRFFVTRKTQRPQRWEAQVAYGSWILMKSPSPEMEASLRSLSRPAATPLSSLALLSAGTSRYIRVRRKYRLRCSMHRPVNGAHILYRRKNKNSRYIEMYFACVIFKYRIVINNIMNYGYRWVKS